MKTMREKRLTQQQAQNIWDDMRSEIALNGKIGGRGVTLPAIDMAKIFAGRQTMSWHAVLEQVTDIVNSWQPPL